MKPRGLEAYVQAFRRLRVGRVGQHNRPHKPCMLLAVLSLADMGRLTDNRIPYDRELLRLFRRYFETVRLASDDCTPLNPFFFLRSDGFWHHRPHPGREQLYGGIRNPGSSENLRGIVDYAYLDAELFVFVSQPVARMELRLALIRRYFPEHEQALLACVQEERQIDGYAHDLFRRAETRKVAESRPDYNEPVRRAGFRRAVTEAYDYRCAACGLRVVLDDVVMVDAAHLVPFSESHNDDISNGMALCKNHHWAMDQFLIAPAPDMKWHVRPALRDIRVRDYASLAELDGCAILRPGNARYWPKEKNLSWRWERLESA